MSATSRTSRGRASYSAQNLLEIGLDTLSIELLDNRCCRELIPQLNDFENMVFGPDFSCECAHIQPWVDSGCLLYSAVTGEAVAGQRRILSVLSVFITTSRDRDRMLRGEIRDFDLEPWTAGPPSAQPTIYLSSVVSAAPHHLSAMYDSLLRDTVEFRDAHRIAFHSGFAIATGAAGSRHMARSGFRLLEGCKYRGSYDLMVIDARSAAAAFWCGLLNSETTFVCRPDSQGQASGSPPPPTADPRTVEKPIAQAEAERLHGKKDY